MLPHNALVFPHPMTKIRFFGAELAPLAAQTTCPPSATNKIGQLCAATYQAGSALGTKHAATRQQRQSTLIYLNSGGLGKSGKRKMLPGSEIHLWV